jgi:hypothetical protein
MGAAKSYSSLKQKSPSILALLVDDISRMSASQQKLLWMQINKKKLTALARELDNSVVPHNLSSDEIDALIAEAKKYGKKKKGLSVSLSMSILL